MMSPWDDRQLFRSAVVKRTVPSKLEYGYSCIIDFLHGSSTSATLHRIPLTLNHRCIWLQWAHQLSPCNRHGWVAITMDDFLSITQYSDSQQIIFSDEPHYNFDHSHGGVFIRYYRGERIHPKCRIESHMVWTLSVMVSDAIAYHTRTLHQKFHRL